MPSRTTVAEHGRVDGLVNVVGGNQPRHWQRMVDFPMTEFDEVLDLNLRYAVLTSQAAARAMVEQGIAGSIVHIASIAGLTASAYNAAYGAGKAALISLTRSMAVEWGQYGIRVRTQSHPARSARHETAPAPTTPHATGCCRSGVAARPRRSRARCCSCSATSAGS